MRTNIILREPEDYLRRIDTGCILDPSIFYSKTHVEAATILLSSVKPSKIYLPSHLFEAYEKAAWFSFFTTLTLWSGNYEKLSDAWYQGDELMKELSPVPIRLSEENEKYRYVFEAMAKDGKLSPLNKILFEIVTCSLELSIPILASSHSKFRLIELLNSKIQTIVVEPLGAWAKEKRNYLSENRRRQVVFTLELIGGAFIFIEPLSLGSVFEGAALASIVIDGS
jgi:hypothetical protein